MIEYDENGDIKHWAYDSNRKPDCYYCEPHWDEPKKGRFVAVFRDGMIKIHYFADRPIDNRHDETEYGYPIGKKVDPNDVEWIGQEPSIIPNTSDHTLTRPLYAIKDGSQWVGADETLSPMTDTFQTLKSLRSQFDASESKGVESSQGKVYQLIYSPLEDE